MAGLLSDGVPACPICPFIVPSNSPDEAYELIYHIELNHPENGESPFFARDPSPPRHRSQSITPSDTGSISDQDRQPFDLRHLSAPGPNDEEAYVDCPANCGEVVHIRELEDHMDLHDDEDMILDDATGRNVSPSSTTRRSLSADPTRRIELVQSASSNSIPKSKHSASSSQKSRRVKRRKDSTLTALKNYFMGPPPKMTRTNNVKAKQGGTIRLGRAELGPHAFEEHMPLWLYQQLERGPKVTVQAQLGPDGQLLRVQKVANETCGIIPVLAQLCQQDRTLSEVYLCHPFVKHVVKMSREGGFCGYRNIQMLASFIQNTRFPGHEYFPGNVPSILHLQDMIEDAWDQGINSAGRVETGGIKGTRKYIGTPEAQALFCSLGIGVETNAFNEVPQDLANSSHVPVHHSVIQAIWEYFSYGVTDPNAKVHQTGLAPIYFQHPGHSITVIGLERRRSGAMNLLVFDPMFKTSPGISRLLGATKFFAPQPEKLLKAYRRGDDYLSKYKSFEILKLLKPRPQMAGPQVLQ